MFIESEGKCSDCGGPTTSAALKLCPKCSARRHQCEHCLAATTMRDETADQSKPADSVQDGPHSDDSQDKPPQTRTPPAGNGNPARPAETAAAKPDESPAAKSAAPEPKLLPPVAVNPETPNLSEPLPENKPPAELPTDPESLATHKPINPVRAGTYTAGKWHYQMQITSPGTKSEGRWGWLTYDGQKLPRGEVNDYYLTPWGPMYWVDVPTMAGGVHGWMPVPLAQNRRQGRALASPVSPIAAATRAGAPPVPSGAAAPTKPRVQTLEINKSHNGQLARVRVGNALVIRLPGDPASGYQWQAASINSPVVRMTVRPQYSPPASTAAGAAVSGTYTFTFQAVQPGTGAIRLYYVRPSDPSRPRDSFAVGVSVSPASATARPIASSRQPGE